MYAFLFFLAESGHMSPFMLGYTAVYICSFIKGVFFFAKASHCGGRETAALRNDSPFPSAPLPRWEGCLPPPQSMPYR